MKTFAVLAVVILTASPLLGQSIPQVVFDSNYDQSKIYLPAWLPALETLISLTGSVNPETKLIIARSEGPYWGTTCTLENVGKIFVGANLMPTNILDPSDPFYQILTHEAAHALILCSATEGTIGEGRADALTYMVHRKLARQYPGRYKPMTGIFLKDLVENLPLRAAGGASIFRYNLPASSRYDSLSAPLELFTNVLPKKTSPVLTMLSRRTYQYVQGGKFSRSQTR